MDKKILALGAFVLLIIAVGIVGFQRVLRHPAPAVVPVACTQEAKVCPDGSTVVRRGPMCAFDPCPEPTIRPPSEPAASSTGSVTSSPLMVGWTTATDTSQKISFQYPKTLGTRFITLQTWPPVLTVSNTHFTCVENTSDPMPQPQTVNKTIAGKPYCLTTESDGAAGSIYTTYTYSTAYGSGTLAAKAVLRSVQCGNYDDPQKTLCEQEREGFLLDPVMGQIMMSVKNIQS